MMCEICTLILRRGSGCFLGPRDGGFLLRTGKNKECNEDQQRIAEKPEDAEDDRQALANPSRNLGRLSVRQRHRQEGAEYSAAVHRKCRNQVEQHQHHIHGRQLAQQLNSWTFQVLELFELGTAVNHKD